MIMTLTVQESGRVKYIKRPGAVLEVGCVVARLELDDPSKVHPVRGARHGRPQAQAAPAWPVSRADPGLPARLLPPGSPEASTRGAHMPPLLTPSQQPGLTQKKPVLLWTC